MKLRMAVAKRYAPLAAAKLLVFRSHGRACHGEFGAPPAVSDRLIAPTRVTKDLAIPMPQTDRITSVSHIEPRRPSISHVSVAPPVPGTEDRTDILVFFVAVSEDLLEPLGLPRAQGKDYGHRDTLFPLPCTGPSGSPIKERMHRKAYRQTKAGAHTVTTGVSIWDLILPLLKPPLDFGFPAQLDLPSELWPFQVTGIQYLVDNRAFLLADEMGTGKTVMAAVALRILFHKGAVRRALVVCPASVVPVWDRHLCDWCGEWISCTVVRGPREQREMDWRQPAHVYVTSYDTLRNDALGDRASLDAKRLQGFDLVILDEAHAIRNPQSGRSRAVRKLAPSHRWALSGTPLQNRPEDLAAVFGFVKPGLFPRDGVTPEHARSLIHPFFLRRRKKDVLPELPDKTRQDLWLELEPAQRRAYEAVLAGERDEFNSGRKELTRVHIFALLTKLKQICNFAPGRSDSPKVARLIEQLEEILDEHKAVVFTQFVGEGIEKLRRHLDRYGMVEIHGGTSDAQRRHAVEEFQRNPDVRIFLGSVKAAGEGITLHEGNYVFHFDHWWNPAVAWQAEDRVHRVGQRKHVSVYSYWMEDTVEERIYRILERKGLLHEEIINAMSEEEIDTTVTMEQWCQILDLTVKPREAAVGAEGRKPALSEVIQALSRMDPSTFEETVAEVFRRLGYPDVRVTGGAGDEGIDIIASRSSIGGREHTAIQCKRMQVVGVQHARELLGAMASKPRLTKGFLVTSGRLSSDCQQFISEHGNLAAIEGVELARKIIEHGVGLPESRSR